MAVEGVIISTSFAPVNPRAKATAEQARTEYQAGRNLHSVPANGNIHAIEGIVEKVDVDNEPHTLLAERRTVRGALAKLWGGSGRRLTASLG
jgi:hypothetical protein